MEDSKIRTSLVVMAAGIGSRFGEGIKQLTSFGPGGEIIMDYSVFDAVRAGFDRVVFVIRKDLEKDFREIIGDRISEYIETDYVFQEKEDLPEGFVCPESRRKPWGTGQAILCCRSVIREPFCVINADDYYGKKAFVNIHDWLSVRRETDEVCMSGFILKNTLSENGGVTRGVCSIDEKGQLAGIRETRGIVKNDEGCAAPDGNGAMMMLDPSALVSMNMWGFQPEFLDALHDGFTDFLKENLGTGHEETAEYLLPTIVDGMLRDHRARVSVLPTDDRWFGVTYHEDIPAVRESFARLVRDGVYPAKLWS